MARRRALRIVIVGAGPVGLMIAALLGRDLQGSVGIQVVDAGSAPAFDAGSTELRVYALSRASQALFERLGLWDSVLERRASPYRSMRVWEGPDPDGSAAIRFDAADIGEPDLGHIVEDTLLRERLVAELTGRGDVELIHGLGVAAVTARESAVELVTTDGANLRADLLIAADGADSVIRHKLDFPVLTRDYRQHALVTHVRTETPHRETAFQRFLPGGPLAFLPLADGRSSIVWSLPTTAAERLIGATEDAFAAELYEASGGVLGRLEVTAPRARFPLRLLHALSYCRQSIALVGDAAHCVHPLAGQGMNLGLLDAASLADVVGDAIASGEHPGDARVLGRYARARKAHNLSMQLAFDALDRLFRLPAWAAPVRELGLAAADCAAPAKALLMRRALGLDNAARERWRSAAG